MIQGGEEEEKGGKGGVGPLGVGEGLSSLGVWLACRHVDVSARLQLGMLACQHGSWRGGMLVCRHIGTLVRWRFGALVCRHIAVLACQCWIVAMAHWRAGALSPWRVGTYKWGRQCASVYFVVERESVHKGAGSVLA